MLRALESQNEAAAHDDVVLAALLEQHVEGRAAGEEVAHFAAEGEEAQEADISTTTEEPGAFVDVAGRLVGRAMREVKDMGQHRRIEPTTVKRPKRFIPSFAQWGDEPGKPPAWMVKQ